MNFAHHNLSANGTFNFDHVMFKSHLNIEFYVGKRATTNAMFSSI